MIFEGMYKYCLIKRILSEKFEELYLFWKKSGNYDNFAAKQLNSLKYPWKSIVNPWWSHHGNLGPIVLI